MKENDMKSYVFYLLFADMPTIWLWIFDFAIMSCIDCRWQTINHLLYKHEWWNTIPFQDWVKLKKM